MKIDDLTEMQRYWLYDKKVMTFPWHTFDDRRNGAMFFPNGGFPPEYQIREIKKWGQDRMFLRDYDIKLPCQKPPDSTVTKIANLAKLMIKKKVIVFYGKPSVLSPVVNGAFATYFLTTGQTIVMTDTDQFIQMYKRISSEFNMDDEFLTYRGRIYDNYSIWHSLTRKLPFAQSHSGLFEDVIEVRRKLGMLFTVHYNIARKRGDITAKKDILQKIDKSIGEEVADALDMCAVFISDGENVKEPPEKLQAIAKTKVVRATRLTTDAPEEV